MKEPSPAFSMNQDQVLSWLRGSGYAVFGALAAFLLQYAQAADQSSSTGIMLAAGSAMLGNLILKALPAWGAD